MVDGGGNVEHNGASLVEIFQIFVMQEDFSYLAKLFDRKTSFAITCMAAWRDESTSYFVSITVCYTKHNNVYMHSKTKIQSHYTHNGRYRQPPGDMQAMNDTQKTNKTKNNTSITSSWFLHTC